MCDDFGSDYSDTSDMDMSDDYDSDISNDSYDTSDSMLEDVDFSDDYVDSAEFVDDYDTDISVDDLDVNFEDYDIDSEFEEVDSVDDLDSVESEIADESNESLDDQDSMSEDVAENEIIDELDDESLEDTDAVEMVEDETYDIDHDTENEVDEAELNNEDIEMLDDDSDIDNEDSESIDDLDSVESEIVDESLEDTDAVEMVEDEIYDIDHDTENEVDEAELNNENVEVSDDVSDGEVEESDSVDDLDSLETGIDDESSENSDEYNGRLYDNPEISPEIIDNPTIYETIGEYPPNLPVNSEGWDELSDVPFAGNIDSTEETDDGYDEPMVLSNPNAWESANNALEDRLEAMRDDLRDRGMQDGPEMEEIINAERIRGQEEIRQNITGNMEYTYESAEYNEAVESLQNTDYDLNSNVDGEISGIEDINNIEISSSPNEEIYTEEICENINNNNEEVRENSNMNYIDEFQPQFEPLEDSDSENITTYDDELNSILNETEDVSIHEELETYLTHGEYQSEGVEELDAILNNPESLNTLSLGQQMVNEYLNDSPMDLSSEINTDTLNETSEELTLTDEDIDAVYEGLETYDFQGVDCYEDLDRLDSDLDNFTAENWEHLSLDEQKDAIEELASYVIDVTRLENPPIIEYYNNPQEGDYGGFCAADNKLYINEYMLYQNDEAADTIAHELWHAYQHQRAENPTTKLDAMYALNNEDYITPEEDIVGYQSQLVEAEARAFAQQIKDRLKERSKK